MDGKVIGEIDKNQLEKIVATLGEYKDKQRIDIRVYFQPDADPNNWIPTKKGINVALDSWPEFKGLIEKIDAVVGEKADR